MMQPEQAPQVGEWWWIELVYPCLVRVEQVTNDGRYLVRVPLGCMFFRDAEDFKCKATRPWWCFW